MLILNCIIALFAFGRLSELNFAVSKKLEPEALENLKYNNPVIKDKARCMLAKSYFDVKEYSR